jgi:hypothetical protein
VAIRTDQRLVISTPEVQVIGLGLRPSFAIISPQLTMAAGWLSSSKLLISRA